MPELPEVEVTRRSLQPQLEGQRLVAVQLGKPLRWPLGIPPSQLAGRTVLQVLRRGKYIVLQLDEGVLLIHLGMSGSLRWVTGAASSESLWPHDHVTWQFPGQTLVLNDPRRFGAVVYSPSMVEGKASQLLQHLGLEPLEPSFTPERLQTGLAKHRAAIKQVLLAGTVVVGVGNIYASEVLFRSGIHPVQPAFRVPDSSVQRLHKHIVAVLSQAVELGGSTLRNFHAPSGAAGAFQSVSQVYGREGLPCLACGTPIARFIQGQRSTFFCPSCQPFA